MSALRLSLSRNGDGPMWDYSRGGLHSENIHDCKGYKHWPYPEPIENMTRKLMDHPLFYKDDGSHKRVEGQLEGKTQPVTDPKADPNPSRTQYRVALRDAHKHMRHNFMNMFLFNYRFQTHRFSAKKDARAWHPLNPMKHYQTGQLDYKDHRIMRKPYFTVADNWKPVTTEEEAAMKERNEIAGRNRRYYWKLLLNPKYGDRHFAEAVTDSQYAKWNRINSQFWYIFNVRPDRRDVIKHAMQIYVLPFVVFGGLMYMWYQNPQTKNGRRFASVVPIEGRERPEEFEWTGNQFPRNEWTMAQSDLNSGNLFSYISSCLFGWADDKRHMQYAQWQSREMMANGGVERGVDEFPKRIPDWYENAERYWDTPEAKKAGSGFDRNSDFWKSKN